MTHKKLFALGCALMMSASTLASCGVKAPSDGGGQENNNNNENTPTDKVERKTMDTYFEGIKVIEERNLRFTNLFERQADVLAQDITQRLHVVYGDNTRDGNDYDIKDNYYFKNENYYHETEDHKAIVSYNHILTSEDVDMSNPTNKDFKRDSMIHYQRSIIGGFGEDNDYLNSERALMLPGAISGKSNKLVRKPNEFAFKFAQGEGWLIQDKIQMKNAIVTGIKEIIGPYNNTCLGFEEDFAEQLVLYINENIIGTDLMSKDDDYLGTWFNGFDTELIVRARTYMNQDTINEYDDNDFLFKNYGDVIPAIVNEALNNKFVGEDVSLYPIFNSYLAKTQTTFDVEKITERTKLVLMPNQKTPVSKIWFKTNADTKTQTVRITVFVCHGSEEFKQYEQPIEANKEYEIDLTEMKKTSINKYNGAKENTADIELFDNNDVREFDNGRDYILVNFELVNKDFGMSFTGINSKR